MKTFYVDVLMNGYIGGYSETEAPGLVRIELPDDHPFPAKFTSYRYENDIIVEDITEALNRAKERKGQLLSDECQRCIEAGFIYEIDGVPYRFSYDLRAQLNFQNDRVTLMNSADPEATVLWTVRYPGSTNYTRLNLNLYMPDEIIAAAERHRISKVSKLRDFLLPILISAETFEEVAEINW